MILVTGGTGHTGRRIVRTLLERGYKVRILTRQPTRIPLELRQQVEIMRGNLTIPEQASEATQGCQAIIAATHIKLAPAVIDMAKAEGIRRCIFMSSTRRFTKFPEETAGQVIAGEQAVRDSGLDWTIIRCTMIYGSARDNNLAHLVAALERFPIHPLIGGGKTRWQPVYTWDVARAIVTALQRDTTIGKEYTIAGPRPMTYKEMVQIITRAMKKKVLLLPIPMWTAKLGVTVLEKVSSNPRIRMDQIRRLQEDKVFDTSDAQRDLDYQPTPFEEAIKVKLANKV